MKKMRVAVVFDFDETLTERHLFHLMSGKHKIKSWFDEHFWPDLRREHMDSRRDFLVDHVFGGHERLATLDAFLCSLQEAGDHVELMISSNNYLRSIKNALREVDLLHFFTMINARDPLYHSVWEDMRTGVVTHDAGRKQDFILNQVLPKHDCVVFVDDEILDAYFLFFDRKPIKMINCHHPSAPGMNERDRSAVSAAVAQCLSGTGDAFGHEVTRGLLCSECREREAIFYSRLHDAVFCDAFCERTQVCK